MKFVISKDKLQELVSKLQNIVAQRATIPILSNVLVEASNDEIVLTATDLTVGMRCYADAKILEEGSTTLPAKRLFQLVRELPEVNVEAAMTSDDISHIVAGASRFKLHGMSHSDFPSLPDLVGATQFKISQKLLRELLYRVSFAVSREENRYVLTGILCRVADSSVTFVGTDGKRLAKTSASLELDPAFGGAYILPQKAVEEVIKICQDKEEDATIYLMRDKVAIEVNQVIVITKLLSGDYPDVEQVIPRTADVNVSLHREELMSLLRQVALFTNESSHSVRFTFTTGELTLTANTIDIGEGKVAMPVNYSGDKLEIAFNPNYFLDILRHSKDETVNLALTDAYNPGVITDSSNGLFVLMPMRLNEQA
jgi:DNA polymerase III subunit beta